MMKKTSDVRPVGVQLYFLPVETRVPLKFGAETLTSVTCARVAMRVENAAGESSLGWGETPLSVQWVWPSALSYAERHQALQDFSQCLAGAWVEFDCAGHPMEVGHAFQEEQLKRLLDAFNQARSDEPMPWLAALVCCSAFDIAFHDAYGMLNKVPVYDSYTADYMNMDLSHFLEPASDTDVVFAGHYPADFLVFPRPDTIPAWHLVGGKDWLEDAEKDETAPDDGYPCVLRDWIRADGLKCLKVKLCGTDAEWDYERLRHVGQIALEMGVEHLSTDFNCMVTDPAYVNEVQARIKKEVPAIYERILYVEQPFPYDLEAHSIDVHTVSKHKPLFMDESAHDWRVVRRGRALGWTGVALKTCKTQTGALLSLCWAKAHGMDLMVQDLTNPMLAQIPHVLLGAHAGTIMGVETNGMQFYPDASKPEATVHPGLYRRRDGMLRLDSIAGPGFGYSLKCIERTLPDPSVSVGM